MRVAIISTPRSGNTWLRKILSKLYDLKEYAIHRPDDIDWVSLPNRCILQIHWHRDPGMISLLDLHGFKMITISRHPLDVLISILHFSSYEPQTSQWLDGEGGVELPIHGCSPTSAKFLDYASGMRSKALLSVTQEWWSESNVIRVRYEDLVHTPSVVIASICQDIGSIPIDIDSTIESLAFDDLRKTSSNHHFWKGTPGIWKSLLPPKIAYAIAKKHQASFIKLGYLCDPLVNLSDDDAISNWLSFSHK